jgi:hypothetical protein
MRLICETNLYAAAAYASSGRSPSAARPASQKLFRARSPIKAVDPADGAVNCFYRTAFIGLLARDSRSRPSGWLVLPNLRILLRPPKMAHESDVELIYRICEDLLLDVAERFAGAVYYSLETEFQAGGNPFDGTSSGIGAAGFGHTKTVATLDSLVVAIADLGGLRG